MLPLKPPVAPMLSKSAADIPRGEGWQYEPKWDGFRAIVFVDDDIYVCSRNGQPLQRYFPELLDPIRKAFSKGSVVDGEIVVAGKNGLDFDSLQLRIHPAESRVKMLSKEIPASLIVFDALVSGGKDITKKPFTERRAALLKMLKPQPQVRATPQTENPEEAESWFVKYEGAGCDGVVAKRAEGAYRPGERVLVKIKHLRTVDCVVGGYRPYAAGPGVGSLLLGLYDDKGVFHHVGHTSSFNAAERKEVLKKLKPLETKTSGDSFGEGRTPGSPSRWTGAKNLDWTAVRPELVCEVNFEKMQNGRFRHAARFLRWRTDKDPKDCDFSQLESPAAFSLDDILQPA
ncbi:MAG: ATP-dependent DNA ligase [Candidatus Dormiibacterota bacterium]